MPTWYAISDSDGSVEINYNKDYYNKAADGTDRKDIRTVCHLESDDALEPERIYYSVNYIEHADENYLREMLKQDCFDLNLTGEMNNSSFIGYSIFFCNVSIVVGWYCINSRFFSSAPCRNNFPTA